LLGDTFWGVQADAAAALGEIRSDAAREALTLGLKAAHPRTRRAVARALGQYRGVAQAADALIGVLERGDASYFVEAEAALALGKTRDPRAFDWLARVMERPSYLDVIRAHALGGMAETRDPRAIDFARDWCAYGKPPRVRVAAIGTLARMAQYHEPRRGEIIDFLTPLADDREFMVRMRLPGAFEEIGDARGLPAVRRLAERDLDGRVQRRANEAVGVISEGRSHIEEGQRLREDMDKLRDDNRKLRDRLDKLEAAAPSTPKAS
jgi:aminopeptidase N